MEERKLMLLAMERIVRSLNDECIFDSWLMYGIPDGDVKNYEIDEIDDGLVEDDSFSEILGLFLHMMARAKHSGGLYVDGIVSSDDWR